jgi:hypothetical protein
MNKLLLAIGCLLLASGCQNASQSSGVAGGTAPAATVEKLRPATDMVVKHSHLPIDYLINVNEVVHIEDMTTNQQLWQQPVETNTHLLINTRGIRINNTWVYKKPLKSGHVYEVILSRNNGL